MLTRRVSLPLALMAGLATAGCAPGTCLHPDCSTIDSIGANVRLCGFPQQQIDWSGEVSKGTVRVGQQIPLHLEGDLDRVVSVRWVVEAPSHAPSPPVVRLEPRSSGAVLTGIAAGGTHPADYVWVSAALVFRDGTESRAAPAYCRANTDWIPADHVFVR